MDNLLIIFHKFDYLGHNNFFALYLCVKMRSHILFGLNFQEPLFPRTISTSKTKGKQITIKSLNQIINEFSNRILAIT